MDNYLLYKMIVWIFSILRYFALLNYLLDRGYDL